MKNFRNFSFIGTIGAFFSVALGAFGAHALKEQLSPYHLEVFKTGVQYQMFHSLALILLGAFKFSSSSRLQLLSGYSFLFGIPAFSGSLYLLALTQVRWFGLITPLGGVAFLCGWAFFAMALKREGPL